MMAGRIVLTVGFGIVMWHILAISLQIKFGFPWLIAILLVVVLRRIVGLINGVLVEVAQIDSFVATLGTERFCCARALAYGWAADRRDLPRGFTAIYSTSLFGIPIPASTRCVAMVLWIVSEGLPIGRISTPSAPNQRAAALNGIRSAACDRRLCRFGSHQWLRWLVLGAKLRIGQATSGWISCSGAGRAFLGSTTIKPGRVMSGALYVGIPYSLSASPGSSCLGAPSLSSPSSTA